VPVRSVFRHIALPVFAAALAAGTAYAQIYPPYPGGYPPGNYPGRYPGTGPSIPSPGKGKNSNKGPMPNFRGQLKQMDSKTITIALDDDRQMQFKRTDKTKFFKNGDEIKDPKFAIGDQVSVEGPEDETGNMIAVNVYWEKAAAASADSGTNGKDQGAYDTWKDAPKDAAASGPATEMAPPPPKADPDDPGPPSLHHGKPADQAREHASGVPAQPVATAGNTAPPPPAPAAAPPAAEATNSVPVFRNDDDDTRDTPRMAQPRGDDLIRKATDAALDFTESLPNYYCLEKMARYGSESKPANWHAIDIVSAGVVYENGKEDYRNVTVNGKPKKNFQETGGAWSTGEFGTLLVDLFSPATAADFHFSNNSRIAGVGARVYRFNVDHAHSHWDIHMGSQSYLPAYRGSVWIDPQTARVLRIEMEAYGFPAEFPSDHVESATDYDYVRLGDVKRFLLPVHSENLSCQRGSNMCSRVVIDFANYHKYSGESTIEFGDVK